MTYKGKAVIINSLALSQMQYISTILYVPKNVINEVNDLIFKFLWPKKVHVKKHVVIQNIEAGGLKMPDFESKVAASKILWLKRLLQSCKCGILVKALLHLQMPLNEYCNLNFNPDFLPGDMPGFYEQLFRYWFTFHSYLPTKSEEIRSQMIWFNRYILVDGTPIFDKKAYDKGLKYINDLLDDEGKLISLDTVNNMFSVNWSVMYYNSLRSSIPYSWKKSVKGTKVIELETTVQLNINNIQKNLEVVSCRDVYLEIIKGFCEKPKACLKWEAIYDLVHFDWEQIFSIPYQVARETNIQSIQYQIIHRFYPCNSILHTWYEDHNSQCRYCDHLDTLEHHFYNCHVTTSFWKDFQEWWFGVTSTHLNLCLFDILFGVMYYETNPLLKKLNFCILFGKSYIGRQKLDKKECRFKVFLPKLKHRLEYECVVHTENDTLESFEEMWSDINQYFLQ